MSRPYHHPYSDELPVSFHSRPPSHGSSSQSASVMTPTGTNNVATEAGKMWTSTSARCQRSTGNRVFHPVLTIRSTKHSNKIFHSNYNVKSYHMITSTATFLPKNISRYQNCSVCNIICNTTISDCNEIRVRVSSRVKVAVRFGSLSYYISSKSLGLIKKYSN